MTNVRETEYAGATLHLWSQGYLLKISRFDPLPSFCFFFLPESHKLIAFCNIWAYYSGRKGDSVSKDRSQDVCYLLSTSV